MYERRHTRSAHYRGEVSVGGFTETRRAGIESPNARCGAFQEEKMRRQQEARDAAGIAAKHEALQKRVSTFAAIALNSARLVHLKHCLHQGTVCINQPTARPSLLPTLSYVVWTVVSSPITMPGHQSLATETGELTPIAD